MLLLFKEYPKKDCTFVFKSQFVRDKLIFQMNQTPIVYGTIPHDRDRATTKYDLML